jgi:hypothetical protein
MAFADLFFPGNPGRRTQLVTLSTQIKTYMETNFESTNDLIDLLNQNIDPSPNLQKIEVNQRDTIKENADVLINTMTKIQNVVDDYDKKLEKDLEPDLYRKLKDPNYSFKEFLTLRAGYSSLFVGFFAVATLAIFNGITAINLIGATLPKLIILRNCVVGGVVFAVLALGADAIISAILGAIERDKLNDAIDELQKVLDEFKPASQKYNRSILKVRVRMEILLKKK